MNQVDERNKVVEVARSWVGTPYHHMGRVKQAGADCATLLAEVYHEAGVAKRKIQIDDYPMQWNLHRSDEKYLEKLLTYVREITQDEAKPGDIVIYHFGRTWSHGGIIVSWPVIIHAVVNSMVLLADGDREGMLIYKKRRFFSPWSAE